ncbi:HAMP domain-containing histidine kinase [Natronomonas salina]|uniref:sensor histidine kinase n=1 Tax=Natronomonas salina TaxID=1710540 RepID=UPI0015B57948|nr:HAMP domain-containing sensor histidine kinase [Natronomonas salina]QLD88754.1 HAMP domain-containing histidine kinase [Natronomonas salina]
MAGYQGASMRIDTRLGSLTRPMVEAIIVLVGLLLVGATLFTWYWLAIDPVDALLVGLPAALIITIMGVVHRSTYPVRVYSEMLRWTLFGLFSLGGFIGSIIVVKQTSLTTGLQLLLFMMGFGSIAGLLVGYSRGQSIEAARKSTRLERQQDRIEFLNQLLRHNVLNKIAIIKGNAALLDEEYDIDDPALETILDQSEDAAELVDNVRVLVASFSSQLSQHPVDLSHALNSELKSLAQSFEDAEIRAEVPAGLVVRADGLLRYTFENVLHNAIEHNDAETPRVEVTAERRCDRVTVTIADNGPGIAEPVRRGINENEVTGNHGIGLYLVDSLVTEYGGSMHIAETTSRGSEVTLTFQAIDDPASW